MPSFQVVRLFDTVPETSVTDFLCVSLHSTFHHIKWHDCKPADDTCQATTNKIYDRARYILEQLRSFVCRYFIEWHVYCICWTVSCHLGPEASVHALDTTDSDDVSCSLKGTFIEECLLFYTCHTNHMKCFNKIFSKNICGLKQSWSSLWFERNVVILFSNSVKNSCLGQLPINV